MEGSVGKKTLLGFKVFIVGFLAFWFPSFVGHAISGKNEFSHPVFFLIFICPFLTALLTLLWMRKKSGSISKILVSFLFLMGILFLGPLAITADGSFSGGGFASTTDFKDLLIMMLCGPLSTLSGSTYDGTLGALLVFSLTVIIQIVMDLVFHFKKK